MWNEGKFHSAYNLYRFQVRITIRRLTMYKIPDEFVSYKDIGVNTFRPESINIPCPYCDRQVYFQTLDHWPQAYVADCDYDCTYTASRCPGCRKMVRFFQVTKYIDSGEKPNLELYVIPAPNLRRPIDALDSLNNLSEEAMDRTYGAAINAYNMRDWTATAVHCGRVLEGLIRNLLPEDKQKLPLAQLLRMLPDHIDMEKPIVTLMDAIRKGRNIAAHFDAEKEPDEETAAMMLDLIDYIIEYLFVLPGRINKLYDKLLRAGEPRVRRHCNLKDNSQEQEGKIIKIKNEILDYVPDEAVRRRLGRALQYLRDPNKIRVVVNAIKNHGGYVGAARSLANLAYELYPGNAQLLLEWCKFENTSDPEKVMNEIKQFFDRENIDLINIKDGRKVIKNLAKEYWEAKEIAREYVVRPKISEY